MATVVYSDLANQGLELQGTLFQGLKFWLAQRVPQRSRFVADIQSNGGDVVLLDKQADIRIVDHTRKEASALPGTHSYTFVEKSIRNGQLERLKDHSVGPSTAIIRNIGSTIQPAKSNRIRFTQDDDRVLWQWVQDVPQKFGGTDGNEIYKQLEAHNPRHPWQSWRDRWIKHLKGRPPPAFVSDRAPLTPPSDHAPTRTGMEMSRYLEKVKQPFVDSDRQALLDQGEDILNILPENKAAAWEQWASHYDEDGIHTAQEWQDLWEHDVRHMYLETKSRSALHETENAISHQSQAIASRRQRDVSAEPITTISRNAVNLSPVSSRISATRSELSDVNRRIPSLPASPLQKIQKLPKIDILEPNTSLSKQSEKEPQISNDHRSKDEYSFPCQFIVPSYNQAALEESPHKRKRNEHDADVDELPSSSPPNTPLLIPVFHKRQRLDGLGACLKEVASTPENSPIRRDQKEAFETLQDTRSEVVDGPDVTLDQEESFSQHGNAHGRQPSPSLSTPTRIVPDSNADTTQAAFQDSTQLIDLDIPPPEDGWKSEDTSSEPDFEQDPNMQLVDTDESYTVLEAQSALPATQFFLNDKTQLPDVEIADPEDGWDIDLMPSSPPPLSDQQSRSASSGEDGGITHDEVGISMNDWFASQIALGYHLVDAVDALKATSMDETMAEYVLMYMKTKGKGRMPTDQPGVWTLEDDKDLEATDARRITRVNEKHGEKACDDRWNYLMHYGDRA